MTADGDLVDLRARLGVVALPRDAVRVAGPDAVAYLQGQISQDVAALAVGATARSFVLAPTGKVDAWVRVTRSDDDTLVLDLDAGHGEALLARLRRFLLRTKAEVEPLPWRMVALRGPGADSVTADAPAELRVPAGWAGVEGVDLLGPDVVTPAGVPAATPAAFESLRIRAGVPALGAELTEATIPAEVGPRVIAESVSFTKGCFTGQELVARIDSRGGHVPRRVRGLVVPGRDLPEVGGPVFVGGDDAGRITSVAPSPSGGAVALVIVARAVEPPAAATVRSGGAEVPATVVDLPFED
jgi:folate-binding protein YgfZ